MRHFEVKVLPPPDIPRCDICQSSQHTTSACPDAPRCARCKSSKHITSDCSEQAVNAHTRDRGEAGVVEGKPEQEKIKLRVLVVEDQFYPQWFILRALKKHLGEYIKDFRDGGDVRLARTFEEARQIADDPAFDYHLVILDNRLIEKPLDYSEASPAEEVAEEFGSGAFTIYNASSREIDADKVEKGYSLAPAFRNKGAVVVGTSSLFQAEPGRGGIDFVISKMSDERKGDKGLEALGDLRVKILEEVEHREAIKDKKNKLL